MTWSEVSRGVPRSPNRHLDQLRVLRQFEIGGLQIQFNGFSDVCAGFLLGFASGRATGEFGAHRRVVAGLGIMFQNDSERHSNSIGQRYAVSLQSNSQHPHVALAPDRLPANAHPAGDGCYITFEMLVRNIGVMRRCCDALRPFARVALAAMAVVAATALQQPRRLVTYCYQDARQFWLGEGAIEARIPGGDGIAVRLDPAQGRFSVRRGTRTLFTFVVEDMSSNALILWSPDQHGFALTYSDSGAIGGFHVRVFLIHGDTVTEATRVIQTAVDSFNAVHYCKGRRNNVSAIKWVHDSRHLLLLTAVYPSGDCGPDSGHAEGYLVAVPDGKIERHLTLDQLQTFPGVCLENDEIR